MEAKLYVIPGSHACRTGMLMLAHKGISYERIELPTGLHPVALRLLGFEGNDAPFRRVDDRSHLVLAATDRMGTVPALRVGEKRVKTNHEIARFLDGLHPDPPLFPSEPDRRQEVEQAERWGDEVFQMAARRIVLAASMHGRDALAERGDDGRLGPLLFRHAVVRFVASRLFGRFVFAADARSESELLEALPGMLDRIDGWIETGVLNGEELYAADFMIAPSLALLCYRPDLRAEIERRPAIDLIDRLLPLPSASLPSRASTA